MVSTRGHRDNEESKSNLPPRECRKPRTTLEEPEDDMFWESDDAESYGKRKTRSGVTFEPDKSLENSVGGSCTSSKRNSYNKSKTNESVEESEKEPNTSHLVKDEDMIGFEGDTDTDDEFFNSQRTSRSSNYQRNQRKGRHSAGNCHSPITKKFVLNGDEISDKSDHESGLRRSSRHRKGLGFDQSWIFGDKKLRGYPNMIHSSEPENDECRPARKPSRYLHSANEKNNPSTLPQRRSQRFCKNSSEQRSLVRNRDYIQRKHNSRQLLCRSRRPPLRYRDSHSEAEEEDEDKRRQGEEDKAKVMTVRTQKREKLPQGKQCDTKPLKNKLSVTVDSFSRDDTENSEDDGEFVQSDHPMSESEDKEDEERAMKEVKGVKENDEKSPQDNVLEFIKPKRERRPVTRLTYEPPRRQQPKVSSDDETEDEQSDGDDDDDDDNEYESKEEKQEVRERYSLRQNRKTLIKDPYSSSLDEPRSHRRRKLGDQTSNLKDFISSPARKQTVFNKRYRATHNSELSSTSSSSDEKEFEKRYSKSMVKARNRCLPLNFSPEEMLQSNIKERSKPGSSLADIDPMHVDKSVTFDCVGGLSQHIRSLKEMIIFPLLYPEVFQTFSVSPPRGVLFYGPPGTGKTLVARALASECSQKNRKVAFFMRKGADCLSKWVGESERQLRLLFDQAYQMRPSIIFFDEIDGLAPVRSTRQDQIHSSIVSTLLALMDGLDSRGEVVVIGATNRIDAIDSALRRPGRFDREFNFPLPSIKARKQIIDIHTKDWSPKPSKRLVQYLSEQSVGYCGADLKALCSEAMLNALRLRYPQIYASKEKLLLDVSKIQIKLCHFRQALSKIVPAGQRVASSPSRKLSKIMQPLLKPLLVLALRNLRRSFPQGFSKVLCDRVVHRPRLLLCGTAGQGQTSHLAPAILHILENISTHKLDIPSLFSVSARAPEEACAQVFHEARRHLPSIIYIPLLDHWWSTVSDTVQSTFLSLLNDFDPATPLLLLATSETPYDELHEQIQRLFSAYREELLVMTNPKENLRRCFFRSLFFTKMTQKPKVAQHRKRILETLPIAPPPQIRKLSPIELKKIEEIEESSLRELRIFLRQICAKLAKNRMFFIFTKPVDVDEVPDYLEVISTPMDLETMMTKIDHHHYQCAEDFLTDIDLICSNALEYNPDRNPEDKLIRHRACTLRDTAYAYIKAEMDTDFEMKCRDIRKARICRHQSGSELAPEFIKASPPVNKIVADVVEKNSKSNSGSSTPLIQNSQCDLGGKMKVVPELNRKRKHKTRFGARSFISGSRKRKSICKDEVKDEGQIKLQENNEAEAKTEDYSELDFEEDSSLLYESETKLSNTDNILNQNFNELPLCNGNLSTEDSRDSMRVTSAADLLYNKSLHDSLQKDRYTDASEEKDCKISLSNIEADESIVSASEPGGPNENRTNVFIDWARLEDVYESCVSITEGCNIDELHHLYTLLGSLIHKYLSSLDRAALLNEVEAELEKFAQFREKA